MSERVTTGRHSGSHSFTMKTSLMLFRLFILILISIPHIFAASSRIYVICPRVHRGSTTTLIVPPDRITLLLFTVRGGSDSMYRKDIHEYRNIKKRIEIMIIRRRQASLGLRRLWKVGTNSWKYMVKRFIRTINTGYMSSVMKVKVVVKNSCNDTRHAIGDDYVEDRKDGRALKPKSASKVSFYSPFKMYSSCMGIVSLWILTGTLFYSYTNEWPIPQSFFYAVDAGMSIGFCTDVAETKLVSKAFTIVYILLGASVVGGALVLFIQDIVEGVVERKRKNTCIVLTKEYEIMLKKEAFEHLDLSRIRKLMTGEFEKCLKSASKVENDRSLFRQLPEDHIDVLWKKISQIEDRAIRFDEFSGTSRGLIKYLNTKNTTTTLTFSGKENQLTVKMQKLTSSLASSFSTLAQPFMKSENRIYVVFLAWVILGITWGIKDQGWDPITATHFAISALATGGLTAPHVNNNGILPAEPSIFCGFYCLFGIPLMAITFGHFARVLVSDHIAAMEKWALTRPITAIDYEIAKEYLEKISGTKAASRLSMKRTRRQENPLSSSTSWRGLCLSDFIVLQILRQGRISVGTIRILENEFDWLDTDKTGLLTLEEATSWCTTDGKKKRR